MCIQVRVLFNDMYSGKYTITYTHTHIHTYIRTYRTTDLQTYRTTDIQTCSIHASDSKTSLQPFGSFYLRVSANLFLKLLLNYVPRRENLGEDLRCYRALAGQQVLPIDRLSR